MSKLIKYAEWKNMNIPHKGYFTTRPISECTEVDWIKDDKGAVGIAFKVSKKNKPKTKRSYKNICFKEADLPPDSSYFSFVCEDAKHNQLFEQLVLDLLNFCIQHIEPDKRLLAVVNRVASWGDLLSKSGGGLTKLAAIGLMTELHFLEKEWLCKGHQIGTWLGPTGAPQDFYDEDIIVELKSRTPDNTIQVSSLEQLDSNLGMYLAVYQAIEHEEGESVNDCVARIFDTLADSEKAEFMDLVTKAGFVREKNFRGLILVKDGDAYLVDKSFPAIQVGDINGVTSAKYTVDLSIVASSVVSVESIHEE